jgi:hypothetical protein
MPKPTTKLAKCGNCGGEKFNVKLDDPNTPTLIVLRCTSCKLGITNITVQAKMLAVMDDRADGSICFLD